MIRVKTLASMLATVLAAHAMGCVPAHHSYSGRNVDCKYCVPPPLPYTRYEDCVCHSCAASKYLGVSIPIASAGGAAGDSREPSR